LLGEVVRVVLVRLPPQILLERMGQIHNLDQLFLPAVVVALAKGPQFMDRVQKPGMVVQEVVVLCTPESTRGLGNTPFRSPSQGNNGGLNSGSGTYGGGGGGGSSGSSAAPSGLGGNAGNGGAGTSNNISGSPVTYAGGGGGGVYQSGTAGTGGSGGGGPGGTGNGGSGVVIIKIPDTKTATFTGGVTETNSTAGGYKTYVVTATSNTSQTVTFS
jgi:hypothetical protein